MSAADDIAALAFWDRAKGWLSQANVLLLGAVIVLAFVIQHYRDGVRDRELERLQGVVSRDSSIRAAAVVKTDSAVRQVGERVAASVRTDTIWLRAKAAANVDAIVNAPVHDTIKIRELAHADTVLIAAGDAMRDPTAALRAAVAGLQTKLGAERLTWQRERDDQAKALKLSQAQHRHWGLGITAGYAAVRTPDGVILSGPGATIGITFRW